MRLFPQIGCALKHWGAAELLEDEIKYLAGSRVLAAEFASREAQDVGLRLYRDAVWARIWGHKPLEPIFLAIGPALVQGPEVEHWVESWLDRGSPEVQLAAIYGSIFLSDEGEGMGFLVQRMMRDELKGGLYTASQDLLGILKDLRSGCCARCGLVSVTREALPETLVKAVRNT
jgi:hypothetical protein